MGIIGTIFDIKEFAVHDGRGVRTTVFFKGCPLKCVWCHNPEGQSAFPELMQKSSCESCGRCRIPCGHQECRQFNRCIHACPKGLLQIAGRKIDSEVLLNQLSQDSELYSISGGGITFSGGEPLMQPEFLKDVLRRLGELGIDRAIETCGFAPSNVFQDIIELCDFVYCDLKLADSEEHKTYTGVPNELILQNINILRKSGIPYKIRVPLIPGITDTDRNISAIQAMTCTDETEYLPYNKMAGAKYSMLGRKYML